MCIRLAPVVVAVSVLLPRLAGAVPPACFAERTVTGAVEVHDENGVVFAGLRAGHRVRVLDDFVGRSLDEALVEVDQPVRVRGYVARARLFAFLKRPVEIARQTRWLLSGLPVLVQDGDARSARVARADLHPAHWYSRPELFGGPKLACADLSGRPPRVTRRSDCYGAFWSSPEQPRGLPMRWRAADDDLNDGGDGPETSPNPNQDLIEREVFLLARSGSRALIEAWDWSTERTRRWVDAASLEPGAKEYVNRAFVTECNCCPFVLATPVDPEAPRVTLRQAAPLRIAPDGRVIQVLRKGTRVAVAARLDQQVYVVVENSSPHETVSTFLLYGWVDLSALASPPPMPVGHRGHLELPRPSNARLEGVRVGMRTRLYGVFAFVTFGRLEASGSFLLPWMTSARYDLTSFVEDRDGVPLCAPLRWQALEKTRDAGEAILCRPDSRASDSVRVLTLDGLAIPNARVGGPIGPLDPWGKHSPIVVQAGPDGSVRVPHVERAALTAMANGFQSLDAGPAAAGGQESLVRLGRERIHAGSVPRSPDGQCLGDESVFDLSSDCLFSFSHAGERDELTDCESCNRNPRAWLFVRARKGDRLVGTARARASIAGQEVGSCLAPSGACFLHALPAARDVSIEVITPEGSGRASVTPRAGEVTEVTISL